MTDGDRFVSPKKGACFTKAEDEVVAIILSAVMGSIVDSWEVLEISECPSECCFSCKPPSDEQLKEYKDDVINKEIITTSQYIDGNNVAESNENSCEEIKVKPQITLKNLLENQKDKIFGWQFLDMVKQVVIVFKRGNTYQGKLSNCRMNGSGTFYWADGSVYQGTFLDGEMTGSGYLRWPDQSWYEGELYQGYRHGVGLLVDGSVYYTGHWKCGMRHGQGTMFYDKFNKDRHYYSGDWAWDCKHGTGLRSYLSGALYNGQWQLGIRHGLGTMVWTNCDVYSGNWEDGLMQGYGEYTWDTLFSGQFVVPQDNCYYGNWEKGIRNGNGTLETNLGVRVQGTWSNGKKHGPADVICSNGVSVYSDSLFEEDIIPLGLEVGTETDSLDTTTQSTGVQLYRVPVNAPSQNIDLNFYIARLNDYLQTCSNNRQLFGLESKKYLCDRKFDLKRSKILNIGEETELRNIIEQYLSVLKVVYIKYAKMCCDVKPDFPVVLMRLMFWQLLRDCNLHNRGTSLADFDVLIAENRATLVQGIHYPFERLQFWQFLHCLIEVSWELYGKQSEGSPAVPGLLASTLHRLINKDLLSNAGKHKGVVLWKCRDLLSLDSVYWFYRGIGEPHSARLFLQNVFVGENRAKQDKVITEYPEHLLNGQNMIGVGGRLMYCLKEYPLMTNHIPTLNDVRYRNHPQDLTCFSDIGLPALFDCLLQVCPTIMSNGLIVNMEYKIIFLEFYEILILCAEHKVKLNKKQVEKSEDINLEINLREKISNGIRSTVEKDEPTDIQEGKTKKAPEKKKKK